MVAKPAAVIFVNNDLTSSVRNMLVKQLHVDEIIDGYSFDARISADSNYVSNIKQLDLRVMVERPFTELENRAEADVAIFVSHGLAAVLKNNFGPPQQTHSVVDLYWGKLGVF